MLEFWVLELSVPYFWVPCSREREHARSVTTEDMLTKRPG